MNKEDVKAIFVIFLILLLISALALMGINVYLHIVDKEKVNEAVLFQGNTTILPEEKEENNTIGTVQSNEVVNQISSSGTNKENLQNNSTIKKEEYYYKQLDNYAKLIYDKFKDNKDNLKTGTYKIEFNNEFNELLSSENGSDLLQEYYQSAMETFLYDNPDVYYLDPTKMYINIQTTKKVFTTTYEVYIDCGENENYFVKGYTSKEQILQCEAQINQEVNKILAGTTGKNDYQKILTIHDYLVDNLSYDETISKENIYNMYGALVNKEAVCEGYAKAFKYLMEQVNVECVIITGEATDSKGNMQNHAWNYVKLNNNWYAIDVTWDDPVIIGLGVLGKKHKYKYFLKGSTTISEDHNVSYTFIDEGKVYTHPTLSIADYK